MNNLTKLFLFFAICTVVTMAMRNLNAFIFFCSLADFFGIWAIVRSLRSDNWL
jgi:hypothetical protein